MPVSPTVTGAVCGELGLLLGTKLSGNLELQPNISVVVGGCEERGPSQRVYVGNERVVKHEEPPLVSSALGGPLAWLLSVFLSGAISYGVGRCWSAFEPRGAQPMGQVPRRALAPPAAHPRGVIGW